MDSPIEFKQQKTPLLEKFGVYYLKLFGQKTFSHHVFDFSDTEISKKVRRISNKGIFLSALTGLILVWPTVYIDLLKQNEPWYIHYSWTAGVTLVSVAINFICSLSSPSKRSMK